MKKSKRIIYTVLFGDYKLLEPEYKNPGWELICFSDRPIISRNWKVIVVNFSDPGKASRKVKIKYADFISCELSIYIDAKFKIKCDLNKFVKKNLDPNNDIAVMQHNKRVCAYDEIKFCKEIGVGDKEALTRQAKKYKKDGFPKSFGLYAPGIMIRRSTPRVKLFMRMWYDEVEKYTYRDIPSFSYVLWQYPIDISIMPFEKVYRKFADVERRNRRIKRAKVGKMPFRKNDHVHIIKEIAQGLHDAGVLDKYLELGIRKGSCFNYVSHLAKEAYAVDIDDCYESIRRNNNLVWYHGKTVDFMKQLDGEIKFDLVFIDADHRHESSLQDFEMILPLVRENGLILLHDTYPPDERFLTTHYCADSYKTSYYIRNNYWKECEIVTLPFYFGISIVRKLDRQLLWMK